MTIATIEGKLVSSLDRTDVAKIRDEAENGEGNEDADGVVGVGGEKENSEE